MSRLNLPATTVLRDEPPAPPVPGGQEVPTIVPMAEAPRFYINQPPRPMLARDAASMYWMSRYIERAEHVARILLIDSNLLVDVGDLAPHLQERQWHSIIRIMRCDPPPDSDGPIGRRIAQYMTFDAANPNSLLSCLTRARENARGIRETISAEMWETLNTVYWSITTEDATARHEESPDDFYRQILMGSMLFQGITDQTLGHDQRWLFTQLAKHLERIDVTCRVIEIKYDILRSYERSLETPLRNINWMAVLRTCCSIEAYRRSYLGDMDPLRVAAFLVLEKTLPRSVRFAVGRAHDSIARIRAAVNPGGIDPAERVLGRLDAKLEYAEASEILAEGLMLYLRNIQSAVAEAAAAVHSTYFPH
jgi:uncharacterized alpha-E superfamily protein